MVFQTLQAHHNRFGFALKSSVMVSKLTWPLNQSNGRVKLVATLSLALSRAWALLWILFGSDWLLGSGLNTLNQTALYVDYLVNAYAHYTLKKCNILLNDTPH